MNNLNTYIIEKLHFNKNLTIDKSKASMPTNKDEFIDFIDTYYREWWDSTTPSSIKTEKIYQDSYKYIMNYMNDGLDEEQIKLLFIGILPVNFIKYMNDKYKLGFEFPREKN